MTKQEEIKAGLKKMLKDDQLVKDTLLFLEKEDVVINNPIKRGDDLTGCCITRLEPLVEPYKEREGD